MAALNIDSVNFKRLIIGGKEFYRAHNNSKTIANTDFFGDEQINIAKAHLIDGVYLIKREWFADPINKYQISTTDNITNITVTKVADNKFQITNQNTNLLNQVNYVFIGDVPYTIKSVIQISDIIWEYTLRENNMESYTIVNPVYTIKIDNAYIPVAFMHKKTNITVYYKEVILDSDFKEIILEDPSKTIETFKIDLFTKII